MQDEDFLEIEYKMGMDKKLYSEQNFYGKYPFARIVPEKRGITHDCINSMGFRSDEFISKHNKKHILFMGCSFTWGSGLNLNQTWSYKLYKKISIDTECSGYFNLSSGGTSFNFQLLNLFKYISLYGNPDMLFINVTSLLRFYGYDFKSKTIIDATYKDKYLPIFRINMYQNYLMLEKYCKQNNIKLISFSWDEETEKFLKSFDTFYFMNQIEIYENIIKKASIKKIENNSNMIIAKDNLHYGEAFHILWSNIIYKEYLKIK
jgi:hypothetical protein